MAKKIISLSVEGKVHADFSKECRDRGYVISKWVENLMQAEVEKWEKE
tara:strand:+ start:1136 stop:1279 length:144 start_codon:yes stop_codon:yes gene_type:complete